MSARRSPKLPAPVIDDLTAAQEVIARFRHGGAVGRAVGCKPRRRVDFNDRIAVAALELRGKMVADPSSSSNVGAWLARLKSRGAGHYLPLQGAAEGLHVLVLDARAIAEMHDASAERRAAVERFAELKADLAELARRRGDLAGLGDD